jgi:hypothetical protein
MSVTGDDGRFAFGNLPAGRFMVSATKAAYLPTVYGLSKPVRAGGSPGGTAIALADGQQLPDVSLRITRGGVVAGVVRGADGRPVRGVQISLAYSLRANLTGERTLATLPSGGATTDARGEYRLFGVPPGEYIASARMSRVSEIITDDLEVTTEADLQRIADVLAGRSGASSSATSGSAPGPSRPDPPRRPTYGYATIFYPGVTTLSNATPVTVGPGEERGGIDFQAQLVPQSRISGAVIGPDGRPAAGIRLTLTTASPYSVGSFLTYLTAVTDAQGQYMVRAVPAADYVLEIRPGGGRGVTGPSAMAWARVPVSVAPGADQTIAVTLQPGRTVSGRISLDTPSTAAAPDFTKMRAYLMNRDGLIATAAISADGQFTIAGLVPEAYRLQVSVPALPPAPPLFVKTGSLAGRDALDNFVNVADDVANASIVLTDRVAEISGAILDSNGRPAPDYVVIVFPADKALWTWQSRRIQQVRPSHDGKFAFRNLPPGDYQLGAVTEVEQYQWFEPAFLAELLGASAKVTLAEGEKKVQEIRLR